MATETTYYARHSPDAPRAFAVALECSRDARVLADEGLYVTARTEKVDA